MRKPAAVLYRLGATAIGIAFLTLPAGARAERNYISNPGFEAGGFPPWVTTTMTLSSQGQRSGGGWAFFRTVTAAGHDGQQTRTCRLEQPLGRTVTPTSVREVSAWVWLEPDNQGNPYYVDLALGPNALHLESARGEISRGWNRVVFPAHLIMQPFDLFALEVSFAVG